VAELLVQSSHWQLLLTALAFVALAGVETLFPLSGDRRSRGRRWFANFALFLIGFGVVFLASPWMFRGAAWVRDLLHFPPLTALGLPGWLLAVVAFLLIDLLAYLAHALFHGAPRSRAWSEPPFNSRSLRYWASPSWWSWPMG